MEKFNERNAGRKNKYTVEQKSLNVRIPVVCEEKIREAIAKIVKPYLSKNAREK